MMPAGPHGARRLKRIPFPPAHPELPRQLCHRRGTLQGDERLRTTLRGIFSILLGASIGRRDSLFEDRAETEVGNGIFEIGIQPLEGSHVGVGDVFHR